MSQKCPPFGAKQISELKVQKIDGFGALLGVEMLKKCAPFWREAHFEGKSVKNKWTCGRSDVVLRGRRKGLCTLSKVSKKRGFCSSFKSIGRRGTFEEDLQRCISHGRRGARDMFTRDVRRSGRWFPEKGCIFEHQIFRFAKMILRDRCNTSYDPASLFHGRRSAFRQMEWKNRKTHWYAAVSSAFLEEVSQNCFAFDVVNLKNWGYLAQFLPFWSCQVQKVQESRRIASFLMLSTSKIEEVSQNLLLTLSSSKIEEVSQRCCVFDVVKFKNWGGLAE